MSKHLFRAASVAQERTSQTLGDDLEKNAVKDGAGNVHGVGIVKLPIASRSGRIWTGCP